MKQRPKKILENVMTVIHPGVCQYRSATLWDYSHLVDERLSLPLLYSAVIFRIQLDQVQREIDSCQFEVAG